MLKTILLSCVLTLIAFSVSQSEAASCFKRSTCDLKVKSDCYVHVDQSVNWKEAEACCVAWGGHLTSVHSPAENYYLNYIRKKNRFTWIGLTAKDGKYTWKDGTPFDYNHIARGEIKDSCFHFWQNPNGEHSWNDFNCENSNSGSVKTSYICKKHKFIGKCPSLRQDKCDLILNGKCYQFVKEKTTMSQAESCCIEWGGHLASIHSDLGSYAINSIRVQNAYTWIGLNDKAKEGTFVWTDGTPFDYNNWLRREPDGGRNQNCVVFGRSLQKWFDIGCAYQTSYVCQKDYDYTSNERRRRSITGSEVMVLRGDSVGI